ncbi:hypothetical protein [Stutzerimonas degradans]|nr:hypothetical protein [Stutzerimonas degradans]
MICTTAQMAGIVATAGASWLQRIASREGRIIETLTAPGESGWLT